MLGKLHRCEKIGTARHIYIFIIKENEPEIEHNDDLDETQFQKHFTLILQNMQFIPYKILSVTIVIVNGIELDLVIKAGIRFRNNIL